MTMVNNKVLKTSRPIGVGLIGAGFAARGCAFQCTHTKGLVLRALYNRTPDHAMHMISDLGINSSHIRITDNPTEVFAMNSVDVVVDATGDVEFGAYIACEAIKNHKHIILINAELDATLGPILKKKADKAGVVYSQADGDQPGVIINLIREVELLGLTPVVGGNIKTYYDRYRTPETEKTWADAHDQSALLATNAVDGTKLSVEMATVANATGFKCATRGMFGPKMLHVDEAATYFSKLPELKNGGIVDYILGAKPPFGIFVIARSDKPIMQKYLALYKMGSGPYYTFYRPFHLCTLESHKSIIDAALNGRATLAPKGLFCEVATIAKQDLYPGDILDGIGGFTVYGVIENSPLMRKYGLLPIGLSRGCTIMKRVTKDSPITYNDVSIPNNRKVDILYKQQQALFAP